jgi:low affinity Fe/Cu permease
MQNGAQRTGITAWFGQAARRTSHVLGTPWAFAAAVAIVVLWAASGPLFGFSDTWQLVINTGTTIVTFLMVFLIQNTQNRDSLALQLKLDELLRGIQGPRTGLVDIEDLSDEDLEDLRRQFAAMAEEESSVEERQAAIAELEETLHEGHSQRRSNNGHA